MTQIDETYRNLSDKRINKIKDFLKNLDYTESEKKDNILPYVAQWLYNNYVTMESTCLIISEIINIEPIQQNIDDIYDEVIPPLPCKSHLQKYLSQDEYFELEKLLEPRDKSGTIRGEIDDYTNIITNFETKQVLQEKIFYNRKGEPNSKFTPVIEAVPSELIIYDAFILDQPRTFKIKWDSKVSKKKFTTAGESSGATIKEISSYLVDAGFSHNPKLIEGAVSCMINSLIEAKFAEIKTDIDNPGFYYDFDKDKINVVKTNITPPTRKELIEAVALLDSLKHFFKENSDTLATVFKWGCMSKFGYATKQMGKWLPWMYLKGSAGSGKTTVGQIPLFIWGIADKDNNVGGSSVDTQARLGVKISTSCDPLIINEPAPVFGKKSVSDMIKFSIESTTARSKYVNGRYKNYPAFSSCLFTANMYLPEDDALLRRFYVLSFTYSLRKSESEKKRFEDEFHISTPQISPLQCLEAIGRYVAGEIVSNPAVLLDDWKQTIDNILKGMFESIGLNMPEWLCEWATSESLEDFDNNQREALRSFFNRAFNNARKGIRIIDEYGNKRETLDIDGVSDGSDFEEINWNIINNRSLDWAVPHISRAGNRYICLTQTLRTAISKELEFCDDLKSIGQLLGWKNTPVRLSKGAKPTRVLKVPFGEFIDFIYPNINWDDDE